MTHVWTSVKNYIRGKMFTSRLVFGFFIEGADREMNERKRCILQGKDGWFVVGLLDAMTKSRAIFRAGKMLMHIYICILCW